MFYALCHVVDSFVDVGKNTPKKSPAGKVRRDRVAAQNQPAGNLQKRCCTNQSMRRRRLRKLIRRLRDLQGQDLTRDELLLKLGAAKKDAGRAYGLMTIHRSMRGRRLRKLIRRLRDLQGQDLTRDELLLKLGAAKKDAGRAYGLMTIH